MISKNIRAWISLAGIGGLCLGSASAFADEGPPRYLTYGEAVAIALRDNVDLLAIRNQEESQKLRSGQALAPNEPVFSYTKDDVPGFSLTETPAQTVYQINWTLGFPGKALATSAAIRHQAEATSDQAIAQEITLMTSLSNTYVSFSINQGFYAFFIEEQKKDKELKRLLEKKYAASQAAKVDLLNAEVVTQNIALNILENRNDYEVLLTQFRQILRRPQDKTLFPQIPETIEIPTVKQDYDDLLPLMLRNSPTLQASEEQVQSSKAMLTNTSLQPFPDFQLTAAVNQWLPIGAPNGPTVTRDYTLGIGIAIPIFFPFNELPGIQAARHDLGAAENQYTSAQLQAISALQTTYTSFQAMLKDLDASVKLVVPAAKASYDLTLLTYGLGKADYFMLNQSRQAWHDSEKDMLTKQQSAAQLYNQLLAEVGCDIQRTEGPHACR